MVKKSDIALRLFCNAYPAVFPEPADSWQAFFHLLETYARRKRAVIFFDDADERNDKQEFYSELDMFVRRREKDRTAYTVLTMLPWGKYPFKHASMPMPYLNPA